MADIRTLLIISPVPTHPSREGCNRRVLDMVLAIRELGFKPFLCYVRTDLFTPCTDFTELYDWWQGDMVHFRTGWEASEGVLARSRGMYVFSKFKNIVNKWRRILPQSLVEWMLSLPVGDGWYPPALSNWVARFCTEHQPVACIVEYAFLSKALLHVPHGTRRIIDAHDMLSERNRQLKPLGISDSSISLSRSQEKRMLERADTVIGIQRDEESVFRAMLAPAVKVTSADILSAPDNVFANDSRSAAVVGYIGAMSPQNLKGIEWFVNNCWETIRAKVPGAVFRVAGTVCEKVTPHTGIELLGSVDDLKSFYRGCRCVINPCLGGTGLKIKCIEALQMGMPLVTTTAGGEGLRDGAGTAFELADTAENFSAHVIEFLLNPVKAAKTSGVALEYAVARRRVSMENLERAIRGKLDGKSDV